MWAWLWLCRWCEWWEWEWCEWVEEWEVLGRETSLRCFRWMESFGA